MVMGSHGVSWGLKLVGGLCFEVPFLSTPQAPDGALGGYAESKESAWPGEYERWCQGLALSLLRPPWDVYKCLVLGHTHTYTARW